MHKCLYALNNRCTHVVIVMPLYNINRYCFYRCPLLSLRRVLDKGVAPSALILFTALSNMAGQLIFHASWDTIITNGTGKSFSVITFYWLKYSTMAKTCTNLRRSLHFHQCGVQYSPNAHGDVIDSCYCVFIAGNTNCCTWSEITLLETAVGSRVPFWTCLSLW